MKIKCPDLNCKSHQALGLKTKPFVRNGTFYRREDSRYISRYLCKSCGKSFSNSTFLPTYKQRRRRINYPLNRLLCSGISQRRAALLLGVNRKTVVRHFRYLATEASIHHENWLTQFKDSPLKTIQFDDLETSEHTKCKPISVTLAVDPNTRKILHYSVSKMPAKGLLAKTAIRKYGYRKDERPKSWDQFMQKLKPYLKGDAVWRSDENPHYPKYLFKHHPGCSHETTKGGRGSVSGQGELKKLRFDPLFALNHTCAMLRANINRLFRRTWCISKTIQGLTDHLAIYVRFHNEVLTS